MPVLVFRTRTTNTNHDLARLASETFLNSPVSGFFNPLLPVELKFDIRSPSRILENGSEETVPRVRKPAMKLAEKLFQ